MATPGLTGLPPSPGNGREAAGPRQEGGGIRAHGATAVGFRPYPEGRREAGGKCPLADLLRHVKDDLQAEPIGIGDALGLAAQKVADAIGAEAVLVLMLDPAGEQVSCQHAHFAARFPGQDDQTRSARQELREKLLATPLRCVTRCPVWEQLRKGERVVRGEADRPREAHHELCEISGLEPRAVIAVPLQVHGVTVGSIQAINKSGDGEALGAFTPSDVVLVGEMAACASLAIRRVLDPASAPTEREIAECLARALELPLVMLDNGLDPDYTLLHQIGQERIRPYGILPLARLGEGRIRAALADPLDAQGLANFEARTGLRVVERAVALGSEISTVIDRAFAGKTTANAGTSASLLDALDLQAQAASAAVQERSEEEDAEAGPIIQLANHLVEDAQQRRASDIHIEPRPDQLLIRYRVDGVCMTKLVLPRRIHAALVSRVKIMSNLDITEHRLPQDGRINFARFNSRVDVDLRVSVMPSHFGESVVMRLLDKQGSALPLDKLGFSTYNLDQYRRLIQTPYGMVLHCGPTGSGKSMTLYAALNRLNSPEVKVLTAEDPIEYTIPGIIQVQTHKDIGLTFASCLRSFLRHDPDIILVGEIRDRETADIAFEAAQTGHLLFATLHTNDAASTVIRLTEMGVEPFLISSSLICVCAQRLVRRLCACRKERQPNEEERGLLLKAADAAPINLLGLAVGCKACDQIGYRGRTGIHELLVVNDEMRGLISAKRPSEELKAAARRNGMRTLFQDAMEKVKAGITSLPEALSVAAPD